MSRWDDRIETAESWIIEAHCRDGYDHWFPVDYLPDPDAPPIRHPTRDAALARIAVFQSKNDPWRYRVRKVTCP